MDLDALRDSADEVRRARSVAEFEEWSFVLTQQERRRAEIDRLDETVLGKELARREVTLALAQALHVSEQRLWVVTHRARFLRDSAPAVWEAFRRGDIDAARAGVIAETGQRLQTSEALRAVEHTAPGYAATHTLAELRAWLRRLRARLEPATVEGEAARAVEERRVHVEHNGDGTSWLNTLLPTGVALAVQQRLRRAAKALPSIDAATGERDRRTRDQKQADLVAHWLTCSLGTETDIRAEIAVSIAATDLVGHTIGPGVTRDGGEPLPTAWVRELATSEHAVFRRLVTDPLGRVLDTSVLTYRPPQSLRDALRWRDGTCRVAGCRAPVDQTDLDHQTAHHVGGPTSADNLRCLCRRHHAMKSHDHLHERHLDHPIRYVERYLVRPVTTLTIDYVPDDAAGR